MFILKILVDEDDKVVYLGRKVETKTVKPSEIGNSEDLFTYHANAALHFETVEAANTELRTLSEIIFRRNIMGITMRVEKHPIQIDLDRLSCL